MNRFSIEVISIMLFVGSFFLTSSASGVAMIEVTSSEIIKDSSLRTAVLDYYYAEQREDWRTTYYYRSTNFQKIVRMKNYAQTMQKSFDGWRMIKLQVDSFRCKDAICFVGITFFEKVDDIVARKHALGRATVLIQSENTLWRKVKGKWVVLDAGDRDHIPLNANVADN